MSGSRGFSLYSPAGRMLGGATGPKQGVSESGAPISYGSYVWNTRGGTGGSSEPPAPRKKIGAIDPYDRMTGAYVPGYGKKATPPTGLIGGSNVDARPWEPQPETPNPISDPVGSGSVRFLTPAERAQKEAAIYGAPTSAGREIQYWNNYRSNVAAGPQVYRAPMPNTQHVEPVQAPAPASPAYDPMHEALIDRMLAGYQY